MKRGPTTELLPKPVKKRKLEAIDAPSLLDNDNQPLLPLVLGGYLHESAFNGIELLNSTEIQKDLQHEIKTEQDKKDLRLQQIFEMQKLGENLERRKRSGGYHDDKLKTLLEKNIAKLGSLRSREKEESAQPLYQCHIALNEINEEIIYFELCKVGSYFFRGKCDLTQVGITRFPVSVLTSKQGFTDNKNQWEHTVDTISLKNNHLFLLPKAIFELPKLKKIDISSNHIYQLPALSTAQEKLFYRMSSVNYDSDYNQLISMEEALSSQKIQAFHLAKAIAPKKNEFVAIAQNAPTLITLPALPILEQAPKVEKVENIDLNKIVHSFLPSFASKTLNCACDVGMEPLDNGKSYLLIDTTQERQDHDSQGSFRFYAVFLVTKTGEKIEQPSWPVNVKQYGKIGDIRMFNGHKTISIQSQDLMYKRLVKSLSMDLSALRDGLVQKQTLYDEFDCQKFTYYLMHGEENTFGIFSTFGKSISTTYRDFTVHVPYEGYQIYGQKENLGQKGIYAENDMSVHYYICLAKDLFVSKFGSNQIRFTSFQQIVDAYMPNEFVKGYCAKVF